jgi:hypothetical protein
MCGEVNNLKSSPSNASEIASAAQFPVVGGTASMSGKVLSEPTKAFM